MRVCVSRERERERDIPKKKKHLNFHSMSLFFIIIYGSTISCSLADYDP